ncbi:MAG: arginase [Clostridiales bacterium]|nr:arginase [Clostridiales bacterium]
MDCRQNKLPVVESLEKYISEDCTRLHMPGHKGNSIFHAFPNFWQADVTEVRGLDDFHHPTGAIKEAQELLRDLFNTEASFFLINGASVGIHAGILSQIKPGDTILVPRHSHRSLLGAMILSGANPVYISSEICHDYGMPLGVNWESFRKKIKKNKDAKLVFLQNPTYEGVAENIKSIKKLLPEKMIVMVDEAHGGHFYFHSCLPSSALRWGCQIVVHGAHKTLGSLTQTGFIHLNSGINIARVKETLTLLQSTSPSYLLLASLDAVRHKLATGGSEIFERIITKADNLRKGINSIPGLHCLEQSELPNRELDPTKLVISAGGLNLSGFTLDKILRDCYGIQVEMANTAYVVAMITIGDGELAEDEILEAFKDLAFRYRNLSSTQYEKLELPEPPPVIVNPREAYFAPKVKVDLESSLGKISGETICPYPPGIPVLCAGEEITHEVMEYLHWLKKSGASWHGGNDLRLNSILVLEEKRR